MDAVRIAEERIERARQSVSVAFPLFIRLLFETETEPNFDIPTLLTDGTDVEYNPHFIAEEKREYTPFFVLHEFAHKFLGHCVRFNPDYHDENDFQLSADYAVNDFLLEAGVNLWPKAYYDRRFNGLSVETIYDIIHKEQQSKPENQRQKFDENTHGKIAESPDVADDEDDNDDQCGTSAGSQRRQEAIERSEAEMQQAAMAGTLTASMERFISKIYPPKNNWLDILAEVLVTAKGMDEYTFAKINKRRSLGEFIFPGMQSDECGPIAVVTDTSGSAGQPDLEVCNSEIIGLVEDLNPEMLIAMSCDYIVKSYQEFDCGEEPDLTFNGGGGTSFVAPFKELEKRDIEPEALIYLTDGFCNDFPPEPDYPVIWVCWQDRTRFEPPFGEVVVMEGR